MKQTEKVYELLKTGEWVCQLEFWNHYMRSPHKRRAEVQRKYGVSIEARRCTHGQNKSFDYRFGSIPKETTRVYRPMTAQEEEIAKQNWLFK